MREVKLRRNRVGNGQFAFVTFTTLEAANDCLHDISGCVVPHLTGSFTLDLKPVVPRLGERGGGEHGRAGPSAAHHHHHHHHHQAPQHPQATGGGTGGGGRPWGWHEQQAASAVVSASPGLPAASHSAPRPAHAAASASQGQPVAAAAAQPDAPIRFLRFSNLDPSVRREALHGLLKPFPGYEGYRLMPTGGARSCCAVGAFKWPAQATAVVRSLHGKVVPDVTGEPALKASIFARPRGMRATHPTLPPHAVRPIPIHMSLLCPELPT